MTPEELKRLLQEGEVLNPFRPLPAGSRFPRHSLRMYNTRGFTDLVLSFAEGTYTVVENRRFQSLIETALNSDEPNLKGHLLRILSQILAIFGNNDLLVTLYFSAACSALSQIGLSLENLYDASNQEMQLAFLKLMSQKSHGRASQWSIELENIF